MRRLIIAALAAMPICAAYLVGVPPAFGYGGGYVVDPRGVLDPRSLDPRLPGAWAAYAGAFYPGAAHSYFAPYDLPGPAGILARHYARAGLPGRAAALALALHGARGGIGPLGEIRAPGLGVRRLLAPCDSFEDADWCAARDHPGYDYYSRLPPWPYTAHCADISPENPYSVLHPHNAALMRYGAAALRGAYARPAYVGELLPRRVTPVLRSGSSTSSNEALRSASARAALLAGARRIDAVSLPGGASPSGGRSVLLYNAPGDAPHWALRALDDRTSVHARSEALRTGPNGLPVVVSRTHVREREPGRDVRLSVDHVHPPYLPPLY